MSLDAVVMRRETGRPSIEDDRYSQGKRELLSQQLDWIPCAAALSAFFFTRPYPRVSHDLLHSELLSYSRLTHAGDSYMHPHTGPGCRWRKRPRRAPSSSCP